MGEKETLDTISFKQGRLVCSRADGGGATHADPSEFGRVAPLACVPFPIYMLMVTALHILLSREERRVRRIWESLTVVKCFCL